MQFGCREQQGEKIRQDVLFQGALGQRGSRKYQKCGCGSDSNQLRNSWKRKSGRYKADSFKIETKGRGEGNNGGIKGKGLQGTCIKDPWTKPKG